MELRQRNWVSNFTLADINKTFETSVNAWRSVATYFVDAVHGITLDNFPWRYTYTVSSYITFHSSRFIYDFIMHYPSRSLPLALARCLKIQGSRNIYFPCKWVKQRKCIKTFCNENGN